MAQSLVGPGKKRHTLTLTEANVTKLQTLFKEGSLPPGTLSTAVDDFLKGLIQVIERVKGKSTFTIKDYFYLAGEQLELLQEGKEKKTHEKPSSKAKKMVR